MHSPMVWLPRCVKAGIFVRSVSTCVGAARKFETNVKEQTISAYLANQSTVDVEMKKLLDQNRLVLFMCGSADDVKSELSMNVVKMLTESQAVPLLSIDILEHPEIMGYAAHKSNLLGPALFKDGSFFGGHDTLLSLHESGRLREALGSAISAPAVEKVHFLWGKLPVATEFIGGHERFPLVSTAASMRSLVSGFVKQLVY